MTIDVVPITKASERDFFALHEPGCYCVAWWTASWDGFANRTAAENLAHREELFSRGHHDGYLLYLGGTAAGWCQCGPRDRLPKLLDTYSLAPDPDVWALTCFYIDPARRKQTYALRLLEGVCQDLARRGVRAVQGYPRRGKGLAAGEVWQGTEGMFQGAGFTVERDDEQWPVYRREFTPTR